MAFNTKRALKWVLIVLGLVLVVLIALVGYVGYLFYQSDNAPLPKPLPALASVPLESEGGEPTTIGEATTPGVPTVLSFWAIWCVPCIAEAKALGAMRKTYSPEQLNILYINVDGNVDPAKFTEFYRKAGNPDLDYHRGTMTTYQEVSGQSVVALPRTYIFDGSGQPNKVFTGYGEGAEQELTDAVKAVMPR